MSREAVNQIIDRAVADESFFEQLRNEPERAIHGYELDEAELSAIRAGAYNVVVRAKRKDREDQAAIDSRAAAMAAPAARYAPAPSVGPPQGPSKSPVAGVVGFLMGIVIIGGGIGGFRYFEHQWPWQALGFGRAAAPASIPSPSLGARAKPSAQAARTASAAASSGAVTSPAATSPAASGSAQLRPSPSTSSSAAPSASATAQQTQIEKAYYQAVGARLATVIRSFSSTLSDLRAGNDPGKNLSDLSNALNDLRQHVNDAPPPDQLKQQHAALTQGVPLMQSNVDQLKSAVEQKNTVQAVLLAAETDAVLNQLQDEVAFAVAPHPELYQPVDSSQQLQHILNFDVISQNVATRNNSPASVTLRIGLQSTNPSGDEISDTLRHSIVAARQSFPQAGQVRVMAFKEANGTVGSQLGTADWYCSPDARPPDTSQSGNWQDSCSKVYVSVPASGGGNNTTTVPY